MKILLIQPDFQKIKSYIIIPNAGLLYLARALELKGHEVQLIDAMKDHLSEKELSEQIISGAPDVAGYSFLTPSLSYVMDTAKLIRSKNKNILQIAGGIHPTCEPEETMKAIPELNFVFQGEGEVSLPLFLDLYRENPNRAGWDVPGLAYRNSGNIICNPHEPLEEPDYIDIPKWDAVDIHSYPLAPNGIFTRYPETAPIVTGRGCPYNCSFCAASKILGRRVRKRPLDHLLREISLLYKTYGIREFHIMDDIFNWDKEYVLEFSKRINDLKLPVCFSCPSGIHLHNLDKEIVISMEEAGIYSMSVGIESGSNRILRLMKKKLTVEEITEKIRLIKENSSIKITGFFIFGYSTETEDEVKKTIKLARKLPIDRANFFNFSPFPGSEIYSQLKKSGELASIDPNRLYIHHIQYHPKTISKRKLAFLQQRAYFSFYTRWKIIIGILKEIKSVSQLRIILSRIKTILFQ